MRRERTMRRKQDEIDNEEVGVKKRGIVSKKKSMATLFLLRFFLYAFRK